MKYWNIFLQSYQGYWQYLKLELLQPSWHNYLYWLIAISLFTWVLEIGNPWRKKQSIIRKDFWLDGFYMFFNFFLFSLILFNGLSNVVVELFNDGLSTIGITNLVAINIASWPKLLQFAIMFLIADFVQWNIHRLLHRIPWLWEFHKLHHSVKEMGFAAHLRFHWMESIVYKTLQYIPLALIGFGINDFFIIHIIAIGIGHLNHANLGWDYGVFKYIFNNPKMHIWHHAKKMPKEHRFGVNFGLSLSIWDYLFKTAFVPSDGKDVELGFHNEKEFPKTFFRQIIFPFVKKK